MIVFTYHFPYAFTLRFPPFFHTTPHNIHFDWFWIAVSFIYRMVSRPSFSIRNLDGEGCTLCRSSSFHCNV